MIYEVKSHGSLIFIEVFKIYKLLNLLKLEKLFFVGSPIVTTLGGSWAVITAVYMVLFGLNFGQNRPFFALQKSNFGFAFENERTVRLCVLSLSMVDFPYSRALNQLLAGVSGAI